MAIKTNKSVKLTQEELQQLTELRTKTSELTFLRGQIGIAEDNIKRQLNELAEQFNELYKTEREISQEMFKKYGKGEVDIEQGTFINIEE
jgi:Na+/phosphate symporter